MFKAIVSHIKIVQNWKQRAFSWSRFLNM